VSAGAAACPGELRPLSALARARRVGAGGPRKHVIGAALAIFKYRLWDLDRLLLRSVTFAALWVLTSIAFVGLAALAGLAVAGVGIQQIGKVIESYQKLNQEIDKITSASRAPIELRGLAEIGGARALPVHVGDEDDIPRLREHLTGFDRGLDDHSGNGPLWRQQARGRRH